MYVAPQGTITLYTDIPIDINFDHTIYFATRAAQSAYFSLHYAYQYSSQMYQRVGKGKLRIKQEADALYNCNYLSFKNVNTRTGSTPTTKTFYAFITGVEYVNNMTTEITYQIDPIQTWLPNVDYDLLPCFVEREHTTSDNVGDNLVPEDLAYGEYVHGNVDGTGQLGSK